MKLDEIITGLEELIIDRDSFITGDDVSDEMFVHDKAVLEAALAIINELFGKASRPEEKPLPPHLQKAVEDMKRDLFGIEKISDRFKKYPQDQESNEYRYIDPEWLDAIAGGLTKGAEKHPGETWRQIPADEHLARAMRHINLYRMGDRSEPHIINASMRLMMAFATKEATT